jgi:hypothetical protein
VDANKVCPNNCNDLGVCVFVDANTGFHLTGCPAQDSSCYAKCECETNNDGSPKYYGKDCSMNEEEQTSSKSSRETLCTALRDNMLIQDLTADVVSGRATSVKDIFADMNLISEAALEDCTAVITETISTAPELAKDYSVASEVTAVLSLILERAKYDDLGVSSSLLSEVYATLALLAQACQDNLAIGETPMSFVDDNLRMTVAMTDSIDMRNKSFAVPVSTYESYADETSASLGLSDMADSENAAGSVGLMVLQYLSNPNAVPTNSTSLLLEATKYDSSARCKAKRRLMTGRCISSVYLCQDSR